MRKLIIIAFAVMLMASCVKKIPVAEPFSPARDLEEANRKLDEGYEEEARRLLENIIRLDTTGEYAPLAHLRVADSYVMEDLPDLAAEEYKDFLNIYPRHKYASYAQYQIGMVYFRLIKGHDRGVGYAVKSLEAFETLNSAFPRNPYRKDALIKIEQCRAVMAEHEFKVGEFYYRKGSCRGAVGRFEGLRKDFPKYTGMARTLYHLAVCYEKLGMAAERDASLKEISKQFPASALHEKAIEEIKQYREDKARDSR